MVCAEPLDWIAYSSCGHKEACSRCVARLRFVLKDKRCVICQQQSPAVIITRNVGAYTRLLPPEEFDRLQVGCVHEYRVPQTAIVLLLRRHGVQGYVERGELQFLPQAEAYVEDREHLEELRHACRAPTVHALFSTWCRLSQLSLACVGACAATHTQCWQARRPISPACTTWRSISKGPCSCPSVPSAWRAARYACNLPVQLAEHLLFSRRSTTSPMHVPAHAASTGAASGGTTFRAAAKWCLRAQVFISEQVLYTKADLEQHMRKGDLTGPLAESGFQGHPSCRC